MLLDSKEALSGRTIYYSFPDIPHNTVSLGLPHYSYRFAADKFIDAFTRSGARCILLKMPEFYSRPQALLGDDGLLDGQTPIHLIFRSTKEIRLLKFGYNIVCFAWEFDILRDVTRRDEHPFDNQVHMLNLCDEVWVPCNYTRDVLVGHGVKNVHVVPAPIPSVERTARTRNASLAVVGALLAQPMNHNPAWSNEESARQNRPLYRPIEEWVPDWGDDLDIFVSVFNPGDDRKNMNAMLKGFCRYNRKFPRSLLIVKLVTAISRWNLSAEDVNRRFIGHKLTDPAAVQSTGILIVHEYLDQSQMSSLYEVADFYLCTSIAEGQNLPLLEAMSAGAIPVSPHHTAMKDYLTVDNSMEIAFAPVDNFISNIAAENAGRPFKVNFCSERAVYAGLEPCGSLSAAQRDKLSRNAVEAVENYCGPAKVVSAALARTNAIRAAQFDGALS